MSLNKYVSEVKTIQQNQEIVFRYLSDFNNFSQFFNEYALEQLSTQMPGGIRIEDCKFDSDSCHLTLSKGGSVGFRIIDRDVPKTIKMTGEGSIPAQMFFWIQLLPVSDYQCKMRLTLHAELNVMLKMMLNKKLKDGIDRLADVLSAIPYR